MLVAVCELAFPEPEPSLVELVDELVEVEACEEGELDPDAVPLELPADVDEFVPVVACEDEPPLAAWLPVDVVVPVCALESPAPAWLPEFVVVPVCALEPPEAGCVDVGLGVGVGVGVGLVVVEVLFV